jgi:F0F1-type ATP synthase membrane subunit b/b'
MGCATTTTSQLRKVSQEEAFSFVQALESESTSPSQESTPLYTQPVNKSEPCKLGTSQDQLDRNNFRAYWDGQCKDGFAYGLGRDIAISDTHHVEQITIYGDNGKIINSPVVTYDFVHNEVNYSFVGNKSSIETSYNETISNEQGTFNVEYSLIKVIDVNDEIAIFWSQFGVIKYFINRKNNVDYRITKNETPYNNTEPIYIFETLDSKSNTRGGFAAAQFANGQIRHFKVDNNDQLEQVILPEEYISLMGMKYKKIENIQAEASEDIEKAKRMEKEYLYLACNSKHEIQGLKKEVSDKICTWRDQFKEPLASAQKQYNENLESMKIQARSQEEKQKIQEQLDYQKRMVQAAERQASAAESANFDNSLNSLMKKTTTCYTNFGITTCY